MLESFMSVAQSSVSNLVLCELHPHSVQSEYCLCVLEHCNALWFLCWCIVVWSWVNMGGLGFCSRALHRAGFAAFWPLVGVILNQPWYCIAWWSSPKPTQNTTSFPPLCLLSSLFGNLSISPTPVLGPRGSQFVVADLCWSWNLKVGVFWNLSKTGNNYHSTISLTIFQGNFWTKISFLDKHLIETNTVSSFPQNFHWLDALKYPPWHRHDICH